MNNNNGKKSLLKRNIHKPDDAEKFWFTLDNAAKIFPAIQTNEFTTVFRLTAVLKEAVRIKPFFRAVLQAEKRFPYFKVQLKKGFFWYYLEYLPARFPVVFDREQACRRFPRNGLLLRIMLAGNRISLEFSHILTDGSGGMEFFKTLLLLYSRELALKIPEDFKFYKPGDNIAAEEYEDSYKRYFREDIPAMVKRSKAFHLPWPLKSLPRFDVTNYILSLKEIKALAAANGVSMNDYLVSVYLFTLQELYEELKQARRYKRSKYIRVQVPINLRKIFPSKTMRNFSLFVMPEIDLRLGYYTFDEVIKTVYHQIRLETDEKLINKNISRNVGSEKKIYIKSIPLFLKSLILRLKYYSLGTNQYSGVLTNLGRVDLPPETARLIDHFIFTPPPPNKMMKVGCGIVGFNDQLILSFGNITKSNKLEEKFLQFLKDRGVKIKTETP